VTPLFFDVKSRQPRVTEVLDNPDYLDIRLNHPISVPTPVVVLFKAEADRGLLGKLSEEGADLRFRETAVSRQGGGVDSHSSSQLSDSHAGFDFHGGGKTEDRAGSEGRIPPLLSFVRGRIQGRRPAFGMVGMDAEVWLKIETERGLQYVAEKFKKRDNLVLVAARGDLYVEITRPHDIMAALKLVVGKDPMACAASRIFLSVVPNPLRDADKNVRPAEVPSCADFLELAWLRDIGYRRMMLCDELCLNENLLAAAVNAFGSFKSVYG